MIRTGIVVPFLLSAIIATGTLAFVLEASAQEPPEQSESSRAHGVARVLLPAAVQRTMVTDRLERLRTYRAALLTRAPATDVGSGPPQGDDAANRAKVASIDNEIRSLGARAAGSFEPRYIDVPYVIVEHSDGGKIAFSKFTYIQSGATTVAVGTTRKDPTQIVVWHEATYQHVREALENYSRPPEDTHRWEGDNTLDVVVSLGCPLFDTDQYIAMRNSEPPHDGDTSWVWAKATGLQPTEDECRLDARIHLRYFSNGVRSVAGGSLADWSWTLLAGELSYFPRPLDR